MRRFKIKNRQKRKYTRKNQIQSPFYLYKSFALNLIPIFLIVAAAFSMFLLIQNNSLLKQQPNFHISTPSTPNISFPNLINYTQSIQNTSIHIVNKTFYSATQTTNNFYSTFTKILQFLDFRPIISKVINIAFQVLTETGKIIIFVTRQIGIATKTTINSLIYFANAIISVFENMFSNLVTITMKAIITTTISINNTVINFVNSIIVLLTQITQVFTNILTSIYKLLPPIIQAIRNIIMNFLVTFINTTNILITKTINILSNILSSIYNFIPPMIRTINTLIMNILATIANSLQLIDSKITQLLNQLINVVKSPFIEFNKEMQPFMQFINKCAQILNLSARSHFTNSDTIFKFFSSHSKNPVSLTPQINSGIF